MATMRAFSLPHKMKPYPNLWSLLKDKEKPSYTHALEQLSHYTQEKTIPNATYVALKETITYMVNQAWENIPRQEEKNTTWVFSKYNTPGTAGIKARIKQIKKEKDCPTKKGLLNFLEEVKPLATSLAALKDKAVKRQPKTAAQRRAEKFTPPASSSQAVAQVRTLLETLVDQEFKTLLAQITQEYQTLLKTYQASKKTPSDFCTLKTGPWQGLNIERLHLLEKLIQGKCAKLALQKAQKIRDLFVVKNLRKLVSILEAKGDNLFKSAEKLQSSLRLGSLEGTFLITFQDGSQFEAKNSIVWSHSIYGTEFTRFPLTFHNVILPNGRTMETPSEKKMNTEFITPKP